MLSRLRLHNYKAFDEINLNISPITLLVGPNNSGKSSIISVLRLLIQTIDSNDPNIPLLLNGIMGDFGTYRDIVYGNHRGRPIEIELTIKELDDSKQITLILNYKYRTKRRELILKSLTLKQDGRELLRTKYSDDTERHLVEAILGREVSSQVKSYVSQQLRMNNYLPVIRIRPVQTEADRKREKDERYQLEEKDRRSINNCFWKIYTLFQKTDYLGAMRRPPERLYLFTGEKRRRIGASGENTASMLVIDSAKPQKGKISLVDRVSSWLQKAGMADVVILEPLSDRHYEIRLKHLITNEIQNIADVGHGNSQVFPVLIGGYSLSRGSVYMVEEPEIHLHPKAQAELGDFFYDLYSNGIQTIIETHSEHLILRLQQHVADKRIPESDICIYYIYSKTAKKKEAIQLRLDGEGKFIDEWPQGFFPERLEEAKRLAQIRFRQSS